MNPSIDLKIIKNVLENERQQKSLVNGRRHFYVKRNSMRMHILYTYLCVCVSVSVCVRMRLCVSVSLYCKVFDNARKKKHESIKENQLVK